jgi:hypothetical protein
VLAQLNRAAYVCPRFSVLGGSRPRPCERFAALLLGTVK